MKVYGKTHYCYCCGPPYERCELCVPSSEQKKKLRRRHRKKEKTKLRNRTVEDRNIYDRLGSLHRAI